MATYRREDRLTMHALRTLRLERAMTQEELSAKAGVSVGTITRIERGPGRAVSPPTVRKLAAALEVPVLTLTRCGPAAAG